MESFVCLQGECGSLVRSSHCGAPRDYWYLGPLIHRTVKSRALLLLQFLLLAVACTSSISLTHTPSLDDRIRALLPGLTIHLEDAAAHDSEPYGVSRFSYSSAPRDEWPYGTGFAIWVRASGEVIWVYLHHGDFPPHAVRWADFDGDSLPDLFFHAGFEDVFTTHVYVNRVSSSTFALSQFAQAYENDDVYAVVTDIDSNGQPELLVPEPYLPEDDPCADAFREYALGSREWREELSRITGRFSDFNFFSGSSPQETDVLELFSKVRIVSFGRPPARESVHAHLKLRSAMLVKAIPFLPEPCGLRAAQTAEHVAKLLTE